jgi:hypothetical protein
VVAFRRNGWSTSPKQVVDISEIRNAGLFDIINGIGARRRGYEQLLCDILTEDEVAIMLIDRALELDYQIC